MQAQHTAGGECSLHQCSSSIYIQALYCGQVSRPEAGSALRAQLQTVASLHRPALCRAQIAGSSRIAPLSQSNRAQLATPPTPLTAASRRRLQVCVSKPAAHSQ